MHMEDLLCNQSTVNELVRLGSAIISSNDFLKKNPARPTSSGIGLKITISFSFYRNFLKDGVHGFDKVKKIKGQCF